jgi:capsular exopolysaccharide synthesis family protein
MNEHTQINFPAFFQALKNAWILITLLALLFAGAAAVYAYFQTSVYSTSATIKIGTVRNRNTVDPLMQAISGSQNDLFTEMEILKSRSMAMKVLDSVDFSTRYFVKGGWKTRELYKNIPFIVSHSYLDAKVMGREFTVTPIDENQFKLSLSRDEEGFDFVEWIRKLILGIKERQTQITYSSIHSYGETISTEWFTFVIDKVYQPKPGQKYYFSINDNKTALARMIQSGVRVGNVGQYSALLRVTYTDTVPLRAQEVVNALCEAYIDEGLERQTSEAEKSLAFLDEQLEVISTNLARSESSLETFKKENVLVDIGSKAEATMATLTEYEAQLTKLDLQLNIVSSLKQYIASGKDITNISFDSLQLEAPSLGEMVTALQEKKAEMSALLVEYTEYHPEVVKVNEQINILKKRIGNSVKNMQRNLLSQKKSVEKIIQKYTRSIQSLPQKELELANLKRSFMVNEKVYSFLLERRAETAVLKASTVSKVSIVDSALMPGGPIKPKRKMIVTVGFLMGLIIGVALTVLRELLDNTIKSKEDIESLSAVPMYGVVPEIKGTKFGSVFLEAFRALRTNLEFLQVDEKYKSIVVTSTVSGEGKTTVAANLAVILAKGGKKVVVIDLDMRRAKLSHYFGLKNEKGISTLLSKKHTLDEVIQPSEDQGVDIIAAGPTPPNPSELLMSEYAEEVMKRLREWYDYIVLDTPPVGLVTDAAILMHRADVSLLVVKYGYTKKEFVRNLDRLVKDHKIQHVGIVFNGVDVEKNYGYGYGYGDKYGGSDYYL